MENLFLIILESRNSETKVILLSDGYHLSESKTVTYSLCSHIEVRSGENREMGIHVHVSSFSSYKGINAIRINFPFTRSHLTLIISQRFCFQIRCGGWASLWHMDFCGFTVQSIVHLYWFEVRYASFCSITSETKQSKIVDHLPNRTLLLLKVSEIYSN